MFDCVMPTRNGRNAMLFTTEGVINIDNKKWEHDLSPIDPQLPSNVSRFYSKAYLRHLIRSKEILGLTIASMSRPTSAAIRICSTSFNWLRPRRYAVRTAG
jgi:queuine tRNA-ribosyltransferase